MSTFSSAPPHPPLSPPSLPFSVFRPDVRSLLFLLFLLVVSSTSAGRSPKGGVTVEPEVVTQPINSSGICVCQPQVIVRVPPLAYDGLGLGFAGDFDIDGAEGGGGGAKPSRYTHTLAYVTDLIRKLDVEMEAQSYAISVLAQRFGMNASLLFPARLPREPFGGPEAAPLTSSSSSASSSSGEQRYRSNSNNNDNRRRGGVTSGRGGGGGGGDRSRGGVAAAAAARGRAPSLPQITPARRNPTPGARTAPKYSSGGISSHFLPGKDASSTPTGSGAKKDSDSDFRRRDALLLDAVAEVQDMMGAQQVVMENAFAAQSKMLGDVIHGCWVRPKPGKSVRQLHPRTCVEVKEFGGDKNGVYTIYPEGRDYMDVVCDVETEGGGWLTIMKRENGDVDFYRGWQEYKIGFGAVSKEFWLGLDHIHKFASMGKNTLRIDMEDFQGNKKFAEYNLFTLGDEKSKYQMDVSGFRGTAGDSLSYHSGRPFSTWDSDNDNYEAVNCALNYKGAWWYNACHRSCLTGAYSANGRTTSYGTGLVWGAWKGFYSSLKTVEMKIRPSGYISS